MENTAPYRHLEEVKDWRTNIITTAVKHKKKTHYDKADGQYSLAFLFAALHAFNG